MTAPYAKRPGAQFAGPGEWLRRRAGTVDHRTMVTRHGFNNSAADTLELKDGFASFVAMASMLKSGWPRLRAHWVRELWRLRSD